jgi:Uma2 family endonuclease
MSAQPLPRLSPEEYLAIERAAEFRSELYDGVMYAMAGGSYPHSVIIGNLFGELRSALRKRGCFVVSNDLRLRVSPAKVYTYPDIMAGFDQPRFADDQKDTLLNPALVIEVLSPSTEAHDRGYKFAQYRQLESIREYVLVSQSEPRVERFERQADGRWVLSEHVGIDAVCRFESVDCDVPLADIYENVVFDEQQKASPVA